MRSCTYIWFAGIFSYDSVICIPTILVPIFSAHDFAMPTVDIFLCDLNSGTSQTLRDDCGGIVPFRTASLKQRHDYHGTQFEVLVSDVQPIAVSFCDGQKRIGLPVLMIRECRPSQE